MTTLDLERIDLTAADLPTQLRVFGAASAGAHALDLYGSADLLTVAGVGLCGSRDASEDGIALARAAGAAAAELGVPLVSGYARGVDTAGHISALVKGGSTIAVLPEGMGQFRLRAEYRELGSDLDGLTVVSQFPQSAGWALHRAMGRNALICALSAVLVVVEPGESGGTIAAAREALRTSRDGRKQPQPLILALRSDHSDASHPEAAKLRRRDGVMCVETAEEVAPAIEEVFAGVSAPASAKLL